MRIHRFCVREIALGKDAEILEPAIVNQWLKVFRMKKGDRVALFRNDGFDYVYEIKDISKNSARVAFLEKNKNEVAPKRRVVLFQSLIKKDKFEWVVEKGAEIGVSAFRPIVSERSEKKNLNIERLRAIAKEATEQSGRGVVPEILEITPLEGALSSLSGKIIVFDSSGPAFQCQSSGEEPVNFFIGPEGGWTEKEMAIFRTKGANIFSLGKATLRAETAAIISAGLLLL